MRCVVVMRGLVGGIVVGTLACAGSVFAANEAETAELLVKFMQTSRQVITEYQDVINDSSKGNKGFTGDFAGEKFVAKFKEKADIDLNKPTNLSSQQQKLLLVLLESGKEVVADAQTIINKQGISFKGFIPAVWGRKTGEKFGQRTGIKLKLTAVDYRFPGNKPDDFESEVLRLFSDPSYPKGKEYSRMTMVNGKPILRMMAPEYASAKCLKCHGEPRGERDITGNKKEGIKEGGLTGAISLMIPVQ